MSLSIATQISGQVATPTCSYCYLYEPLEIAVLESDVLGTKLYMSLEISETRDSAVIITTEIEYGIWDINPGEPLSIDLMEIAQQYHDSNLYIYSNVGELIDPQQGWTSVVSEYRYKFIFYTDVTATESPVFKLPIIGGRSFRDFIAGVDETQSLTEASIYGVDLSERWEGLPFIQQSLAVPTDVDARPTISNTTQTEGCESEAFVIYKSRYGGWMTWGFNIKIENQSGSYSGSLPSKMLSSTLPSGGGQPYVPVDYTGVDSSYGYNLKDLALSKTELRAVSGIHASAAIYFINIEENGIMELMRKTGASTPISSLANGGDFSLSLSNISISTQKTR